MLGKIFNHNESIIFYTNIFSLIKQLFLILKDKKKIKRISQNSYHIIKNNHTVEKRVERLIGIVDDYQSRWFLRNLFLKNENTDLPWTIKNTWKNG